MKALVSLASGVLFGFGLALGGMTDPAKVIGFLDLAGRWDPSLAFVMGGALMITLPAFQILTRRSRPLLETRFFLPTRKDLDGRLVGGAALFGIGWGIAGLCPGPAVASLYTGAPQILAFVVAMVVGMAISDAFTRKPTPSDGAALTAR